VIRVLVVEDEDHLAVGLRFNLENAGYEVSLARSADEALAAIAAGPVDLVVLDVGLAGGSDGYAVAQAVRRAGNFVPIIMLTARDLVEDRVRGIDAGADDYVTKPFDLDELLARVRGLLRRQVWARRGGAAAEGTAPGAAAGAEADGVLRFGPCSVDFATYRAITHDGREVQLSPREAQVMRFFAEHEGEVVTRAMFLEKVWGDPATLETRTIDNFILRLRKLFEKRPRHPVHILSVRGVGYRFVR
jgi:two-component system alkaline phosphatase synthesis response regulator PhoP